MVPTKLVGKILNKKDMDKYMQWIWPREECFFVCVP